ncbi:hypothetical protein ABIB62_001936 [Mucilaginibacter sp. UYP25]|uniref:hypothetical protein n=1 Tax=unclassified Mucilaginibacter TaxID=2617802 RepID=UPI003394381D
MILFTFPIKTYCQNSKSERIILSKVAALPEVRSFMKTARASKPQLMMEGTPGRDSKHYWVKVGLSNLDMFRTQYDFHVDPKTSEIFFLDRMVKEGPTAITLKQWREYYRSEAFNNKMHTYKKGKLVVVND